MPGRRSLHPDEPRGLSLVPPPTPAASPSEPEPPADSRELNVQQMFLVKEEDPWIPSLDPQDPEGLNIKEEEDQLWTSPEEKPFHGQGTDIRKFSGSAVTVKSENEEEKPELSQLYQIKTEGNRESEPPSSSSAEQMKAEADGEDCGGPEAAGNPDLDDPLASNTDEQTSDSSETEVSDEDYWGKSSDTLPETVDGNRNRKPTPVSDSGVTHNKDFNTAGKPYSCSECGKEFLYKRSFKKHLRFHTEEKPFDCHECGKRFKKKVNLQCHMRVHTGEKPFTCDDCGKAFSWKETLRTHRRVHTGKKPFACNDCGKRFSQSGHLKEHTRVHTGEKPFACNDCGKRFSKRDTLKEHTRVHTGEKIFACNDCGKRFSQRGNLKVHTRVHTGEKPFSCSDCSKRFSDRGNLKRHMKVHTRAKTKPQLN
ncbi:uncharacterized protein ACNS7B_017353 isoform 2-T2 [Menidia menidia]